MNLLEPSGKAPSTSGSKPMALCDRTSIDEDWFVPGALMTNITLRKQFAYYAMAGNPMNFTTISRSGFLRFAKDCELHQLRSPSLTDAELYRIFALAAGPVKHITYNQWLRACEILFHHTIQPLNESFDQNLIIEWMQLHVIAHAKTISSQPLAPDISQTHVMKLVRERMWTFKQIFCHFGNHSLTEVRFIYFFVMYHWLRRTNSLNAAG